MKRLTRLVATLTVMMIPATAPASDAETSATAGSNRYHRNGTAAASADYAGRVGFARTDARSGPLSTARGVAVGVDESGLSLSVSNAFAPRYGPAVATSFNLSIDRNGRVSRSRGMTVSDGPIHRSATAGGRTGTGRHGNTASAFASGKTDRFGRVRATTNSHQYRPTRIVRVHRQAPRELRRYRSYRR